MSAVSSLNILPSAKLEKINLTIYGLTVIFSTWLCIGLLFYIKNNGGSGLALPFNIITWIVIGVAVIWIAITAPQQLFSAARSNWAISLLYSGALLWSLPLINSPSIAALLESSYHVVALWGLLGFLWLLRYLPMRSRRFYPWLMMIGCAAVCQGIYGFFQITILAQQGGFSGDRPLGIFQQVNVLSSFEATGLACLVVYHLWGPKKSKWLQSGVYFALIFLPFMLILQQSRMGIIAATLSVMILSYVVFFQRLSVRDVFCLWLPVFFGAGLAASWLFGLADHSMAGDFLPSISIRNTFSSTKERWKILQTTLQMIQQHPWMGTGYGGFEHGFSQQVLSSGKGFIARTLIHPHNELLYAWAEGGIIAVAGLVLMFVGIFSALWQKGGMRWIGIALILPIVTHINLEYPLYQSVPHGMVLAILLSMILPQSLPERKRTFSDSRGYQVRILCIRGFIILVGVVTIVFMVGALQTQQRLIHIERQKMAPLALSEAGELSQLWNPYSHATRLDYDRHVALLIKYNLSGDESLLKKFDSWADDYLNRHNDSNIANSQLMINRAINPDKSSRLCLWAQRVWPYDKRFRCTKDLDERR